MTPKMCYLAVFLLLAAAITAILRPDLALREKLRESGARKQKLRHFQKQSKLSAKASGLQEKIHTLVETSKLPRNALFIFLLSGAVGGFFAGRIVYNSLFVSVCVALACAALPLLFLSLRQNKSINARLERLESSMMILSNSYIVTDDIIKSVEQNIDLLEYPEPFRDFLTYVTRMDSNIRAGLRRMEDQVDNPYFSQWIDALILAQEDRNLKYVTVAVVESMHDMICAQQDSDAAMYAVWRDYFLTLTLIFSVPLIFKFLMHDAYLIMTHSFGGQVLISLLLVAVVYSVIRAVRINRPLIT